MEGDSLNILWCMSYIIARLANFIPLTPPALIYVLANAANVVSLPTPNRRRSPAFAGLPAFAVSSVPTVWWKNERREGTILWLAVLPPPFPLAHKDKCKPITPYHYRWQLAAVTLPFSWLGTGCFLEGDNKSSIPEFLFVIDIFFIWVGPSVSRTGGGGRGEREYVWRRRKLESEAPARRKNFTLASSGWDWANILLIMWKEREGGAKVS